MLAINANTHRDRRRAAGRRLQGDQGAPEAEGPDQQGLRRPRQQAGRPVRGALDAALLRARPQGHAGLRGRPRRRSQGRQGRGGQAVRARRGRGRARGQGSRPSSRASPTAARSSASRSDLDAGPVPARPRPVPGPRRLRRGRAGAVRARAPGEIELEIGGLEAVEQALAAERGQACLLNFWATWCPPCVAELPDLIAVAREYEDARRPRARRQLRPDGARRGARGGRRQGAELPQRARPAAPGRDLRGDATSTASTRASTSRARSPSRWPSTARASWSTATRAKPRASASPR